MPDYFRPIAMQDAVRPPGALPLAGGWCWFDRVERLNRRGAREVMSATAVPGEALHRLTAPRADIAGLSLDAPRLMGILNVTPDSFSDGGRFAAPGTAIAEARRMAEAGADLIDIGGESTRPGATEVPDAEERARVLPVIEALAEAGPPISVDTRKSGVARAALAAGATLVNDVSALTFDPCLAALVAETGAPVCLMHAQGDPATMQDDPRYEDVRLDVYDALESRLAAAEAAGIPRGRVILDPGIGFGKTVTHNLTLLRNLSLFHGLGCALMLGASRKGFIGRIGEAEAARDRVPGSIAAALAGVAQGVQILRVHDVAETRQALRVARAIARAEQEQAT